MPALAHNTYIPPKIFEEWQNTAFDSWALAKLPAVQTYYLLRGYQVSMAWLAMSQRAPWLGSFIVICKHTHPVFFLSWQHGHA